jgi:hypothetical protein
MARPYPSEWTMIFAATARAIREYLDRRIIAAAAAWHASLDGEDAAALAEFDLVP